MENQATPALWEKTSHTLHADCRVYKVFRSGFTHPVRQSQGEFYVMEGSDWVLCLPITPEGKLVLVRQFRFGAEKLSWELPGGCIDAGELPLEAAERELSEETGYTAKEFISLGKCSPNPALQNNHAHFVVATDVQKTNDLSWDEHEELETRLFTMEETLQLIKEEKIFHALTINAIFYYQNFS